MSLYMRKNFRCDLMVIAEKNTLKREAVPFKPVKLGVDSLLLGIKVAVECHCQFRSENVLKLLVSGFITATGFVLGMVLAGVGGLSAKTFDSMYSSGENAKNIENYWHETGINFQEIGQLISNEKCYSTAIYFKACLNTLIENAIRFELKLAMNSGQLEKIQKNERLDEKSEKELLQMYSRNSSGVDFTTLVNQLFSLENEARKPFLAAQLINSFLSVYFDPHTYIMPSNFYDEVGSKLARSKFFVGIAYEKVNGDFFIRKISKNSDADLAGLKINDRIAEINGLNVKGSSYRAVSSILRNENSTDFTFKVQRNNRVVSVTVKRTYRELSHVQYSELNARKNYGLITLSKFNSGVCQAIAAELKTAEKSRLSGLILDLRDNPGGQLNEAACVAGLFLGKNKKAYYVEYFDANKANEVVLTSEERAYSGPMVVLVNSASASAAELIAGGLQEYKRALIIGEMTFGKGTFQESEEWLLNEKISLYKTQGLYLLPSRNSTQLVGIKPNVELHAEISPVKRESVAFFNPVSIQKNKYAKLKANEVVEFFTYKQCFDADHFETEDIYLRESIRYLSCAQYNEKLADRDTGEAAARGF